MKRFRGGSYSVDFSTYSSPIANKAIKVTIILRTITREQFEYLRTQELQRYHADNPFSEAVPVCSNVENGLGIFAGYSADARVVYEVE